METPVIEAPETDALRWTIKLDWGELEGGKFRQRADNGDIYCIRCNSIFIVHTDDNHLEGRETHSINFDQIKWTIQPTSVIKEIEEWANNQKDILRTKYLQLANGDVLIAAIETNTFQQQAVLYKMDSRSKEINKGLRFCSLVPLQSNSFSEIDIQKIFVKNNQYYIILQIENMSYWYVLDSKEI